MVNHRRLLGIRRRYWVLAGLGLTVLLLWSATAIMPDSRKVLEQLHEKGIYPNSVLITLNEEHQIHFIVLGDSSKSPLLLIHGSPGDWSAWEKIIENDSVRDRFYMLIPDRAGYGKTTIPAQASLVGQTKPIWQGLEALGITKGITIVGHSYGGAVAEQLVVDHPEAFKLAVFAAGTLSPIDMQPRWYNKVARWGWVNRIIGAGMRSSNTEMLGLPESLQQIEPKLADINTPIVLIQGEKDVLVPFETVQYYKSVKKYGVTYILLDDENHFFLWTNPFLISDVILGNKSVVNDAN